MKIGVIRSLAGQHPVRKLCRTLGVARSAYSAAEKKGERPRAKENVRLGGKARELFEASGRTCGSPCLTVALRRAGERCGRHRMARLMVRVGLRARQKRRFRPRTTDSRHLCPIAPNHLAARDAPPARPGEGWQADIFYTGWHWLDPVTSLAINAIIVWGTWGLLRDATNLALDAVPTGIDTAKVRSYLEALPGVVAVHDLHIWGLSTTQTALTVHLVKPDAKVDDGLLARACEDLREKFGIAHATIQLERGDAAHPCQLAPDHVI